MSESEKKELSNEELEEVIGGAIGELSGRQRYYVKDLKTGVYLGPFETKMIVIRAIKQLLNEHPYEVIIAEPGSIPRD